jgi:apolipoprotein D and lipocalin family protein
MFYRLFSINLIFILFLLSSCNSQNTSDMVNETTVKELDINKYLGTWYEIARFPHSFEKGLVGVTATYSLRSDGKIKVLNQGYKDSFSGTLQSAIGKAKTTDQPGKLKVAFFLFFYANYYIMELDSENYQWALIGSNTSNYLWILSRTPHISEELYSSIVEKAKGRGYDISKLSRVPQP